MWVLTIIVGLLISSLGTYEPKRKRSKRIIESGNKRPITRFSEIPKKPGVYQLFREGESKPHYIGKSNNLYRRIGEQKRDPKKHFDQVSYHVTHQGKQSCLEKDLIERYHPPMNIVKGSCPVHKLD